MLDLVTGLTQNLGCEWRIHEPHDAFDQFQDGDLSLIREIERLARQLGFESELLGKVHVRSGSVFDIKVVPYERAI